MIRLGLAGCEKSAVWSEGVPQRLKPNSWQSIYGRPNARYGEVGRSLQENVFFHGVLE